MDLLDFEHLPIIGMTDKVDYTEPAEIAVIVIDDRGKLYYVYGLVELEEIVGESELPQEIVDQIKNKSLESNFTDPKNITYLQSLFP